MKSKVEQHRDDPVKSGGVHYTPTRLAEFVAARAAEAIADADFLKVLDPACGDGALLLSFAAACPPSLQFELFGLDTDGNAVEEARANLAAAGTSGHVEKSDFLEAVLDESEGLSSLMGREKREPALLEGFDVVIANPPYVRTQILGSVRARQLGSAFGLSGRVDLYHAFVAAMTLALRPGGVLALLCSNRFLTTKSGLRLREDLRGKYEILGIYDLGDTKVFNAAVLPAVVVARKSERGSESFPMVSIYEARSATDAQRTFRSTFDAITSDAVGPIRVGGSMFEITRGRVTTTDASTPWVPQGPDQAWVQKIDESASCHFRDVGKIRVGIKTTADKVFIRADWDAIPTPRPEAEVMHPLITHHVAERWSARKPTQTVLYPYRMSSAKRTPLDLKTLPGAAAYLELHRERLESRKYVVEGGREWWEIWVPQQPAEWARPKIVFPDISEQPRFFLDKTRAIVNGDCYWLPVEDEELALLMIGVANSSLGARYYDAVCGNRLYSGRRRFITQYVERFPIPDRDSQASLELIEVVRQLMDGVPDTQRASLEADVDRLVCASFGVEETFG